MGEDRLAMSQRERDRLKVLHETSKGQITQKQAAAQLRVSERHVRRMLKKFNSMGDSAVVHGLRGRVSNRRIGDDRRQRAIEELKRPECADFGPTFAAEHLQKRLSIKAGKDTVRQWMMAAGLWKSKPRKVETIHQWRSRRSCSGELVQWDTSVHEWLEGRGECRYLIAMIDDATSRVYARFVGHDSTAENMRVLWGYLERFGRPLAFYTDKAAMFETTPKRSSTDEEGQQPAATQITRALMELGIERISAHSPQAKGRIERFFETAQDRLVKELRIAGIGTMEAANQYLASTFLPDWEQRFTTMPANTTDAHRPLTELHNLPGSLSHVEMRTVASDYTIPYGGQRHQITRDSIQAGLKGQQVRVESRLDGSLAVRFKGKYLDVALCGAKADQAAGKRSAAPTRKDHNRGGRSGWMRDYPLNLGKSRQRPV
jgi:hypothetical protein